MLHSILPKLDIHGLSITTFVETLEKKGNYTKLDGENHKEKAG
jgi:hypothetical protein